MKAGAKAMGAKMADPHKRLKLNISKIR